MIRAPARRDPIPSLIASRGVDHLPTRRRSFAPCGVDPLATSRDPCAVDPRLFPQYCPAQAYNGYALANGYVSACYGQASACYGSASVYIQKPRSRT